MRFSNTQPAASPAAKVRNVEPSARPEPIKPTPLVSATTQAQAKKLVAVPINAGPGLAEPRGGQKIFRAVAPVPKDTVGALGDSELGMALGVIGSVVGLFTILAIAQAYANPARN